MKKQTAKNTFMMMVLLVQELNENCNAVWGTRAIYTGSQAWIYPIHMIPHDVKLPAAGMYK